MREFKLDRSDSREQRKAEGKIMRKIASAIMAAGVGVSALMYVAGPATASQNIPYTWNSGDHDIKANFIAYGDVFHAYEYRGSTYVDYDGAGKPQLRWYIPGNDDRKRHTNNQNFTENKSVKLNACQNKENWPDDCSGWKYGVS